MRLFEKLTPKEAGALFIALAVFIAPLVVALLLWEFGLVGRAWHFMRAGF